MRNPLSYFFPAGQASAWLPSGLRRFWAHIRGFKVEKEGQSYKELAPDHHHEKADHFEQAGDWTSGANNGLSAVTASVGLLALLPAIHELVWVAAFPVTFSLLLFQSSVRVYFNWIEWVNAPNRNFNKASKLFLNTSLALLAIVGLTVAVGAVSLSVSVMPTMLLAAGAMRTIYHLGHLAFNSIKAIRAKTSEDSLPFREQAYKRAIQATAALSAAVLAGLVSFKVIILAPAAPVAIAVAGVGVLASIYSCAREYGACRKISVCRWLFKDYDQRLLELSQESLEEKIARYQKTENNKKFWRGGGLKEELAIIKDRNAYQDALIRQKFINKPFEPCTEAKKQQQAAQTLLKNFILMKINEITDQIDTAQTASFWTKLRKPAYFVPDMLQIKQNILECLVNLMTGKVTTLSNEQNKPITIANITALENFFQENHALYLASFSAFGRKQSNCEILYRSVIQYHKDYADVLNRQAQAEVLTETGVVKSTQEESLDPVEAPQQAQTKTLSLESISLACTTQPSESPEILSIKPKAHSFDSSSLRNPSPTSVVDISQSLPSTGVTMLLTAFGPSDKSGSASPLLDSTIDNTLALTQ